MHVFSLHLLLLLLLLAGALARAQDLLAALDYGAFQGAYSDRYNISYWQKIPFAAPPVGENRFRAPQPPGHVGRDVYNSTQRFSMCPQRETSGSEDCLYLGLYSRPWTRGQPLRPVVVVFYGGGFVRGSASFEPRPSLYPVLELSADPGLVVVYPNYRTNAFGFLPGRQVAADHPRSDLNPGLLDQRAAIEWTSRYIRHFGGDPDRITIQGQSAGGGSVVAQVIAQPRHNIMASSSGSSSGDAGPRPWPRPRAAATKPLFAAALANSPFWPKTYAFDSPEAQWIFDTLSERVGCGAPPAPPRDGAPSGGDGDGRLACLKAADVQVIRDASLAIADSHLHNTSTFTWAPVLDGRFLRRPLSSIASSVDTTTTTITTTPDKEGEEERRRAAAPAVFAMYNTHEGEDFIHPPGSVATAADFGAWLAAFLPGLDAADLAGVALLYPERGGSEAIGRYDDAATRAGLVYRDVVLACPAFWLAGAGGGGRGWLGEYSIAPAKHASDVYWWNAPNTAHETDRHHFLGYTGAMASFMATGDPNTRNLTANSTVPTLDTGYQFHVRTEGFGQLKLSQLPERCALWKRLAHKVPI
ncbi:hypothetical protein GGTG_03695 [Gaeumannomyces tritici R3-111a-1]|uniref:Carboxylic ester hydrolase n=1 Tax=Gaeumannomyces tritici (strain R3-111a-1) TaxID=644352 RepID=J3NQZ0_GAET3|nr:hypothetical protein GGTG_03695 [Gaeumannomyces tritici R3-111a-1]EJT78596.1 hypothetical protein GGTG_03695 [Gaeumannomyces tritici R3-111a-1]